VKLAEGLGLPQGTNENFEEGRMQFLKGRANRATYWLGLAIAAAAYIILNLMSSKQVAVSEVILIFIAVPRLHDVGMSAWWAGGAFLLEIAIAVISFVTLSPEAALAVLGLFTIGVAGLLIWLGAVPGQPFANRFGEPPASGLQFKKRSSPTESQ
jgi:uncharacterized membrane protein YhaH (DUF805 family)